jgi:hypothetical protein
MDFRQLQYIFKVIALMRGLIARHSKCHGRPETHSEHAHLRNPRKFPHNKAPLSS